MRVALVLVALAGCRNVLGIPAETEVETFAVTLDVRGLYGASDEPAMYLDASDGSERQTLTPTQDGVHMFPRGLLNGVGIDVTATSKCQVNGGSRMITGEPVEVDVVCDGILSLDDFGFTAPLDTSGGPTAFVSRGSILTLKTGMDPEPHYPEAAATPFRGSIPVSGLVDVAHNDLFEVRVSAASTVFQLITERTLMTSVQLAGAPDQFGYGKPPQVADGAHYGATIDTFDNYVLVGMPGASRAVLYSRTGRKWSEVRVFDSPTANSGFGTAVALGKDHVMNRRIAIVGAPGANTVYKFTEDGSGGWAMNSYLGTGGELGAAVALEKAPGGTTLLVGAPAAMVGGQAEAGKVIGLNYLTFAPTGFEYDATDATQPTGVATAGARFGSSIAIADTLRSFVIGAPGERSGLTSGYEQAGAIYLFPALPSGVGLVARKTAPNAGAWDHFGTSVAMSADAEIVAVGAPLEDSPDDSMDAAGAAYIFSQALPTGLYVPSPNLDTGDGFGASVALRRKTVPPPASTLLVVGAPFEDSGLTGVDKAMTDETQPDAGAVYIYEIQGANAPVHKHYCKASNASAGDQFGASVALTLDSLLVGAPYEDGAAVGWNGNQGDGAVDGDNGAVYTFR